MKVQNGKKYSLLRFCKICNLLLLFFVILDPTNSLFGLKVPVFILFCVCSVPFFNVKYFYVPLTYLGIFFVSLFWSELFNENLQRDMIFAYLKSFLFLFYLFYVNDKELKICKTFYNMCILLAIVEICLLLYMRHSSINELALYHFATNHNNFVMVGHRSYYGIFKMDIVFYKTSPLLCFSLVISLYFLYTTKKKKYLVHTILFFLGMFISGTRANILTCVMLVFLIYLYFCFKYKKRILFVVFIGLLFVFVAFYVIIFLLVTPEPSTDIKSGHLKGYMELFNSNLLKTLTFGFGPAKYFYSYGVEQELSATELTYMDLIKNYGVVGTLLMISMLCVPILNLINNKKIDLFQKYILFWGYVAYLFIAGTNPLLISSTGFILISIMFYVSDKDLFEEFNMSSCFYKKLIKYNGS